MTNKPDDKLRGEVRLSTRDPDGEMTPAEGWEVRSMARSDGWVELKFFDQAENSQIVLLFNPVAAVDLASDFLNMALDLGLTDSAGKDSDD